MKYAVSLLSLTWLGLWLTPDQQGDRLMHQKKYQEAAALFEDPMWQGAAWFRAGEFEKSIQAFSRISTPQSYYNQGNAWVMLGKYDLAVERYDLALKARPDWKEAQENRQLAVARAKLTDSPGGEMGDQTIGADEIVFDKSKKSAGEDTELAGNQATSDAEVQAIWLRQVSTNPADFLKSKFAFQHGQTDAQDGD